jgi:hypothetical protein
MRRPSIKRRSALATSMSSRWSTRKDSLRFAKSRRSEAANLPFVSSSATASIQNDHRTSRNSRTICTAGRFVAIVFVCCARSNHSNMLGRSAVRSSSRLMRSDKLMPSRAARAFRVLCTRSGTSLTCTILDMSESIQACATHVQTRPQSGIVPVIVMLDWYRTLRINLLG